MEPCRKIFEYLYLDRQIILVNILTVFLQTQHAPLSKGHFWYHGKKRFKKRKEMARQLKISACKRIQKQQMGLSLAVSKMQFFFKLFSSEVEIMKIIQNCFWFSYYLLLIEMRSRCVPYVFSFRKKPIQFLVSKFMKILTVRQCAKVRGIFSTATSWAAAFNRNQLS